MAVAFSGNGEYIAGGNNTGVGVWRVEDSQRTARMKMKDSVCCLAYSQDGGLIAAGTRNGEVVVWDGAKSYRQVFWHRNSGSYTHAVDFSRDSTRLVSASDNIASVWDIATRQLVLLLRHDAPVVAAKYSQQGDRIAIATSGSVRVYDNINHCFLVDIEVRVTPRFNTGLWFNDHLLVVSDGEIKQIEPSTGSIVSQWRVPGTNEYSCISLPKHEEFVAYSANRAVTVWDTLSHTQLGLVQHDQEIHSIAVSPDAYYLAIGGEDGSITIESLSYINAPTRAQEQLDKQPSTPQVRDDNPPVSIQQEPRKRQSLPRIPDPTSVYRLDPTFREPDFQIDDTILDLWKNDGLTSAEALLTAAVTSQNTNHYALASRALVRARSREWDTALVDAEKAIEIQPSVIGYIAKSIALVGRGEKLKAYRTCDIALVYFDSSHISFLLLIKAIVVFMAGECLDAISRVDDLIATVPLNSICYIVQAYMYLLSGNSRMECSNYEDAIQLFKHARAQVRHDTSGPLFAVSLISGWKFDHLHITIYQRLCEALYAAGCTNEAGESLLELINIFDTVTDVSGAVIKWISDFTHRHLSAPAAPNTARHNKTPTPIATLKSPTPTPLLRAWARATLTSGKWKDALVAAGSFTLPEVAIYRVLCDCLEESDHVTEAIECFSEMTSKLDEDLYTSGPMSEWVSDFTQRRLSAPGGNSDAAPNATPTLFLRVWAKAKLAHSSWKDALLAAVGFTLSRVAIYRVVCEHLETTNFVAELAECFLQMTSEIDGETNLHDKWFLDIRQGLPKKLECLGDTAADAQRHDEAISHYTTALSLNPPFPQGIFIKRYKAFMTTRSWKQALDDADLVIALDPLSPWGYEMKHAALHNAGEYEGAIEAFEAVLSKIAQSPNPDVQQRGDQYISPSSIRATIRKIVQRTIRRSPQVLIDTDTGRLHDRAEQASSFESLPIFNELVSSMTTRVNYVWIKREVRQHFRYVMLSHKWEGNEPLFQQVMQTTVYALEESPTHDKLKRFCEIVRDGGLKWAWSDTCCINKSDHFVLQEALVAMFKWYEGSALTIVFLRGVHSWSQLGALVNSIWNTRAWTLQEYVASKVVHFYTEDWSLYLDLQLPNHKESREVISEMEQATGVSSGQLMALRPGLTSIREKLRLASTRQTTLVEDAAYSLLGIFSVAGLPAIYGEGEGSLGRLLAHVLAGSGDVSILAWTGESGSFNSFLPAHVTVFNGPATSHLPPPISNAEMERIVAASHSSSFDLEVAVTLYDHLNELPAPWFAASRMKLPCIAFQLPPLTPYRSRAGHVYRADTTVFGTVEITTRYDLSRMKSLFLVHPWLDLLLEQEDVHSGALAEDDIGTPPSPNIDDDDISDGEISDPFGAFSSVPEPVLASHHAPVHNTIPMDRETRARRLVARLRQPFGALLVTPAATSRRRIDYRRVAADSSITVRFQENVSLAEILDNVRTLDVL